MIRWHVRRDASRATAADHRAELAFLRAVWPQGPTQPAGVAPEVTARTDDGALGVNYWLPVLLVGWNTFVSRIIFAFLLPLLLTAPFGIYSFLKPHVKIDLDKNPNDTEDPNTEEESNLER